MAGEFLQKVALDYWFGRQDREHEGRDAEAQRVPANVYETEGDIVIVAPMPGVDADNVEIEVMGTTVKLSASLRGPGQADRTYLLHEWTYGPYERTVTLPMDVDARHANASHDNGVLVVTLPKLSGNKAVRVPLRQVTSSQSTHRGHSGHHTTRDGLDGDEGP